MPNIAERGKQAVQEIFISDPICMALYFDLEVARLGHTFSIIVEGLTQPNGELAPLRINFATTMSQWNAGVGQFDFRIK